MTKLDEDKPMFERYTEKARRVIFFARYEASQFGSPSIEAEHILLGLLREDRNLLNRFISPPQASIESIRKEIEGRTKTRERISTSVDLPFSDETESALEYAAEESELLGHDHIGTEHILLGLLRVEKSVTSMILHERGLNLDAIREELKHNTDTNQQRIESGSKDTLRGMLTDMRTLANAMLNLCDKIETKYTELLSASSRRNDADQKSSED
jgi:ATP-dependent Clp protease ATP-binding subunit ClpC